MVNNVKVDASSGEFNQLYKLKQLDGRQAHIWTIQTQEILDMVYSSPPSKMVGLKARSVKEKDKFDIVLP